MSRKLLIAPLLALGLASAPALAQGVPVQHEARIPFANLGGIRDWRSEGDRVVYIQDRHRDWYKATLMSRATDLPFAEAIGFDPGGVDTFDHFSTVVVAGQRYAVQSLVRIDGPPPKHERAGS